MVRLVQDARKGDGLQVSDRILVRWSAAGPELAALVERSRGTLADTRRLPAHSASAYYFGQVQQYLTG